jgi:hypothetical protein
MWHLTLEYGGVSGHSVHTRAIAYRCFSSGCYECCSHLNTSGSRVCDLILGPVDGQVPLVTHLEEDTGQFWVLQNEHQALQSSAT